MYLERERDRNRCRYSLLKETLITEMSVITYSSSRHYSLAVDMK